MENGTKAHILLCRAFAPVLLALFYVLISASSASAHAVLTHTEPHQDSSVDEVPPFVQLDFNEPVEVSASSVRVFNSSAARVDEGSSRHVEGTSNSVEVALKSGLPSDVYTATYRVVSADGHPVIGGFSFSVGTTNTAQSSGVNVANLLDKSNAGPAVEISYGVARGLHFLALLVLIGVVPLRLVMWKGADASYWPRRTLIGIALLGLVSSLSALGLQGVLLNDFSIERAFDPRVMQDALDTKAGEAWAIRAAAWPFAIAALALKGVPSRIRVSIVALITSVMVISIPYGGHANTHAPKVLLWSADVVHVIAAGVWFGGLVLLAVAFWPTKRRDSHRLAITATERFSRMATWSMATLIVGGSVQAWFYVGSIENLFNSTYGQSMLVKIVVLVVILAVAIGSRKKTSRLSTNWGSVAAKLRRAIRIEIILVLVVLAATSVLVRAAPPAQAESGPVVRTLDAGPLRLQMDIEPAKIGANDIHLYLFDAQTGAQVAEAENVTIQIVQAEKEIGPIEIPLVRAGPAHYEILGTTFGVAGEWDATVTVRISKFDQYSAETSFDIR